MTFTRDDLHPMLLPDPMKVRQKSIKAEDLDKY